MDTKHPVASKTLWFSAALMVLGAAEYLAQHHELVVALVRPEYAGPALAGIGLAVAVLRLVTRGPIGGKTS